MISEHHKKTATAFSPTNEQLERAMKEAGYKGGTFLDSVGQTDLRLLASDTFEKFIQEVLDGYHGALEGFASD